MALNRPPGFRPQPVVNDSYWPWMAMARASAFGIAPLNTPVESTPQAQPRAGGKITAKRRAPSGGRGRGRGRGRGAEIPAPGELTEPTQERMVARGTYDAVPSAGEASGAALLTGEVGPIPFRQRMTAQSRAMTSPEAVAPAAMGMQSPQRDALGSAVATGLAPDAGTMPAFAAIDRQLPSKPDWRAAQSASNTATGVKAEAVMQSMPSARQLPQGGAAPQPMSAEIGSISQGRPPAGGGEGRKRRKFLK